MKKKVIYIHGQGGNAGEAVHYVPLFQDADVAGLEYHSATPMEAVSEFPTLVENEMKGYDEVILIANSIGAYFALLSLAGVEFRKVFFISPVVDMEEVVLGMMAFNGITEDELREKEEITTVSGEVLSFGYLSFVREHPISWNRPVSILYAGKDFLQKKETIERFAGCTGSSVTVMEGGEHWFHTEEQMSFLDSWILKEM